LLNSIESIISSKNNWMLAHKEANDYLLSKKPQIKESIFIFRFFFRILFSLIGSVRVISLYFKQNKNNILAGKKIDHLIGSTQLGYNENLKYRYANYFKIYNSENKKKYFIFDEYDKYQFTGIYSLSLFDLFLEVNSNAKESAGFISQINDVNFKKLTLLFTIQNLSFFSYFSLLFRSLKKINHNLEFFNGGSELFACAAINEDVKTNLLKHGLMSRVSKLSFIDYSNIYVYSSDEKEYLDKINKQTLVRTYKFTKIKKRMSRVLILGNPINLTQSNELKLISEISIFFNDLNFETFYKYHPSVTKIEQKKISAKLNIATINNKADCNKIIHEILPMFCFGWRSTGLCESLNAGVIPVTTAMEAESSLLSQYNFIYPFHKKSLSWDLDQMLIKKLSNENYKYEEILSKLISSDFYR